MNVSKRIKKIASLVDSGSYVIDIGCDHALTDIYLTLNNHNKCTAVDINDFALKMAQKNIAKYNLDIELVKSDGFKNLDIKKTSTCIITGMGTSTIIDILDSPKIDMIDNFIIQTNNDYYLLRKEMIKKGYFILDELAFQDKKIWYIVIKFQKGKKKYKNSDLEIGPILKNKKDEDTLEYFNYMRDKYTKILNNIPKKYIMERFKIKKLLKRRCFYEKNS